MLKLFTRSLPYILCVSSLAVAPVAFSATPVSVRILRFIQVQDPDKVLGADLIKKADNRGDGDYYARVRIGTMPFERNRSNFIESTDLQPTSDDWHFSRSIDGGGTIPVVIQMWDADTIENNDDIIDLNPQDNVQELILNLDLESCTWSGDAGNNGTFSRGDGDTGHTGLLEGGHIGKIWFDVACSQTGDIDKDGIPDGVERFGIRDISVPDNEDSLVLDMEELGFDPCRPNIGIEIDYMDGQKPSDTALERVDNAFDGAGLLVTTLSESACPYPGFPAQSGGGIGLITIVDDELVGESETPLSNLPRFRDANFNPALRPYFHYSLWVNKINDQLAGQCCSDKDFIVGLGSRKNDMVGTIPWQSIVYMHEFGHALGLSHGGGDKIDADSNGDPRIRNCKPNYLSIMNYVFAFNGIIDDDSGDQLLDFSRSKLPTLNENALFEIDGIGDGSLITSWADQNGTLQSGRGDQRLDWDNMCCDNKVSVDITAMAGIGGCAQDADGNPGPKGLPSPGDKLSGWNDWKNIKFRASVASGAMETSQVYEERITPEEIRKIQNFWQKHLRCSPPDTGTWIIRKDCTIWRNATAPGNLIVDNSAVLKIASGVSLNVDFNAHSMLVKPGARVEVQPGGRIE